MKRALQLAAWGGLLASGLAAQSITPNAVNFGNVLVGKSATQAVRFSVPPNSNGAIFQLSLVGTGFSTASPLTFDVLPNVPQTVNITFTPPSPGSFSGVLQGTYNLIGNPNTFGVNVPLQGTGVVFTISPTSLAIGDVLLGCSAARTMQVIPIIPLNFSLSSDSSLFTATPSTFVTAVTQAVQVRFTPTSVGAFKGTISVAANQNGDPVPGDSLSVTGQGFDVSASTTALDFGSVPAGGFLTQIVSLATTPTVTASLQISAASNNPAFTVIMNGRQALITFRPTAAGSTSGTVTFTITRTDSGFTPCSVTRTVAVSGTGTSLGISLSPTAVDFGAVTVGDTSPNRNVSLNISGAVGFAGTASSNNAAFLVSPSSFNVAPGGSQAFTLNFRPSATGPASGTLTFSLTSTSTAFAPFQTSLTLPVTGTGQAPVTLTVTPTTLDFGDVSVGLAASRTVTVSNTGQATGSLTATSTNANVTVTPSSFSLSGGGSQQVVIGFLPGAPGSVDARVDFTAAGNGTVSVGVTGRGVIPTFSYTFATTGQGNIPVAPGGSIGLPTTAVGSANTVNFQVRNSGTVAGTVSRIVTSGGPFTLPAPPSLPASLGPGEVLTVAVRFQPGTPGTASGSLNVDNQSFTLTGIGLVRSPVTFTGAAGTLPPRTQQSVGFQLPDRPATALTGRLTLEFSPNALGGDDQAIQFSTGGRAVDVTVPANTDLSTFTGGVNQIGFQSGTVAGTITIRLTLQAGGVDVTPSPAPVQTFTVGRAGPVIVGTPTIANRTGTGFQVVVTGYATTREVNTAAFRFNASGTGSLQTPSLTLNVNQPYTDWYSAVGDQQTRATNANLYGGQFTLTVPFNVTGDLAAIRSITVTLSNGDGASAAVDVSF